MIAIDPGSNAMGWALYCSGTLKDSGVVVVADMTGDQRIAAIHDKLLNLKHVLDADVLVIEKMFRYNAPLVWSVAAAILAIRAPIVIEMPVRMWQTQLDDSYVKSDERDAIEIGKTLVNLARANL